MIKLIVAISSYEIGGVSSIAKNLLDSLDRKKFQIVFMAEMVQEGHYPIPDDVRVVDLKLHPKKRIIGKIFNLASHIRNFRRAVVMEKPDLILSLSYNLSCYLLLIPISKLKRRVLVGEFSENFFVRPLQHSIRQILFRAVYKLMMHFSYRHAERIIVVSKSLGRQIRRSFNIPEEKIKVIPTPVNLARIRDSMGEEVLDYEFSKDYIHVSFLSRLSPEKGIEYLLLAFSKLKRDIRSRLIIIGEGRSRQELEEMAVSLGIQDDVIFLGYKDNPFKYLARSDMFVLPSLYEGLPNVILESHACGVPVIATRCVGGIDEIIDDGKSGLLVDPADEDSLYRAMQKLAQDKELRGRLIEGGKRQINSYDLPEKLKDYEEVFLQTTNK